MDNVVDFGREKFNENLDQISYRIFCYGALRSLKLFEYIILYLNDLDINDEKCPM